MLEFFRKYQRYFFILITIVIVISFSFFGTYNTLPSDISRELPAFRAVDGTLVSRAELDEMVLFLSTDMDDKLYYGGAWGPNFLNNGVIKNQLLQTGVAELLAMQYAAELAPDFENRTTAEKRYPLYVHPQAKFISTESAWSYFAPTMLTDFQTIQQSETALSQPAFAARVRLFLGEKNFSSPMLQQVLRYQEKQFPWITPDENLGRLDLSLFGYHTISDWFGPRFMSLMAEFIINSAKIAEQHGYRVSKTEALADLINNANVSFQQNLRSSHLGVANSQEYYSEQLRRMGMDQNRAAKVWQNVLLARRLFEEAGHSVFVSPVMFSEFVKYAKQPVRGEFYQLPKELKLGDYRALQKFEVYLDAVAARSDQDKAALSLPQSYLTPLEISKKSPELVQKHYELEIAHIDKKELLPKISVPDTWRWEGEEANWARLQKKFADLGLKPADSRQARMAILDSLPDNTRAKVDAFARAQILAKRPELIAQALEAQSPALITVGLSLQGAAGEPFTGVDDVSALIALLDRASTGDEAATQEQAAANQQLAKFSLDQRHFYKIKVIERLPNEEVLTFAEANRQGILDRLLDRTLQAHYLKIRDKQANTFQKADASWKDLADVKDPVADSYFAGILRAIQAQETGDAALTGSQAASRRLLPYVKEVQKTLESHPEAAEIYVRKEAVGSQSPEKLAVAVPLMRQWQLEKRAFQIDRSSNNEQINTIEALELPVNSWSSVVQSPSGAIYFYLKLASDGNENTTLVNEKTRQSQGVLSAEAQRILAIQLLSEFKAKKAMSINYMETGSEMSAL